MQIFRFFLNIFHQIIIFFPQNKIGPWLRFRSHPFCIWSSVFDGREQSLPATVRQKAGLCYFPGDSDHEAAYSYSSVMFLFSLPCHCLRYQHFLVFLFVSRYIYADPLHCNMTYLFIRLLKDDLKEHTYAARSQVWAMALHQEWMQYL